MRKLLKGALILALAVILSLVTFLVSLCIGHYIPITLPTPRGPFAVGRVLETWADAQRPDPLIPERRTELVVWVWYPCDPSADQRTADYIPAHWRRVMSGGVMNTLLWRDLAVVHAHSVIGRPISPRRPRYPVVILRPGLGALTTQFTTLAEELASHGYVVIGFDAPYRTGVVVFPDGRVVTRPESLNPETLPPEAKERLATRLLDAWVSDVGFIVGRLDSSHFGSRLDLQRVGIVGHSLGGATALQFCHDDARCRAAVDLDGRLFGSVVREGLQKPVMFLLSDHGKAADPLDPRISAEIQSVYDRLPPGARQKVVVPGANHFSFSDQWLVGNPVVVRILRLIGFLKLEPQRGLMISSDAIRQFLDAHLQNAR